MVGNPSHPSSPRPALHALLLSTSVCPVCPACGSRGGGCRPGLAVSQHSLVPTVCPAGQSSLPGPEVSLSREAAEHKARRACAVTSEGALHPAEDPFAHRAVKASLTTEMIGSSLNRAPVGRETALIRRRTGTKPHGPLFSCLWPQHIGLPLSSHRNPWSDLSGLLPEKMC